MTQVLIIGYGNTTRGDDACGILAVDRLRKRGRLTNCDYITACQPYPEMTVKMALADLVIFVDTRMGEPPGLIEQQHIQATTDREQLAITHYFTPEILLNMAKTLYGHEPESMMFSITGNHFEFGEVLSPGLDAAIDRLVDQIEATVLGAPSDLSHHQA